MDKINQKENMDKLYQKKHELWMHINFASFSINDENIKSRLYDFAQMAFRHMKWIGSDVLARGENYNYDRDMQLCKQDRVFAILMSLKKEIENIQDFYGSSVLGDRLRSDDKYLMEYLDEVLNNHRNNVEVTAFNMKREWEDLAQDQVDALTQFLLAEVYKEYELILIYAYMQARTENVTQFNVYQDLVDESHFHLKSFGNMMAKLGLLNLPRELHEMTYIIKDLDKFVEDGIAEEEAAKEMCKELSESITDEKLSKFFDFINFQESYHIELMKKLL
jgi:rubrerythrin